ncbi:type VII secretion protein EccE [Mycolicibacterium aubagnense]|uniref:Type VII secretion system protein EccE domain-containing protein n=1 Tax=Mycolicibacterium aubagnense TaxID=319707 RepID=A0ABM7IN65_9MYCO|nr:type VII secretion protein EccE [Mycolicibacterium aubagnense]BBX88250.1 hypothetical protein MAUB_64510 [Mycolicibacterium aubagnense]
MKQRPVDVRLDSRTVIAAEIVTGVLALGLAAVHTPWVVALPVGALVALLTVVLTYAGAPLWKWVARGWGWVRHRDREPELPEPFDVTVDDATAGVVVDGNTVCLMIAVWGRKHIPTLIGPQGAETPNTLPLTVIAETMRVQGLRVDVDVIAEGQRTSRDNYSDLYQVNIGGKAAVGQRTTTLLVRFDSHAADTVGAVTYRRDNVDAAAAAAQRITRALNQANCRAKLLTAREYTKAMVAGLGGDTGTTTYRDNWSHLHRGGRGYVTSYFFSAEDLTAEMIDDVWSYPTDHTALVLSLRTDATGPVRMSGLVRLTTVQPLQTPPAAVLNRCTGRQWDALVTALPSASSMGGLPRIPVTEELNAAVSVGASGVMIGKWRDQLLLMPMSDPASTTTVALRTDDDRAVRKLIRRAATNGYAVAVYDPVGRWSMAAGSPRIWFSPDPAAMPPFAATMVVHSGQRPPQLTARTSVAVNPPYALDDADVQDIVIEQQRDVITLRTSRFRTQISDVTFRNEETYLR